MNTITEGTSSPSPSRPKKQQKRQLWRRLDNVLMFTSSKRVHGLPYNSHHHAHHSDPNNNPTTSHSDSGSSGKSRAEHHRYGRSSAKAKGAGSSSSASMWVRVSDMVPTASPDDIVRSEDLEVCPASPKKCIPNHQQQKQQNCQVSFMEMDADQEDTLDGSSEEGCPVVDVSQRFIVADPPAYAKGNAKLVESDEHKLSQRQKQIDYGKNTLGYERYLELVPRKQRKKYVHPQTPNIKQVCSKRSWDGQVRKWRRRLHEFDPPASENEEAPRFFSSDKGYDGSVSLSEEEKDGTMDSGSEGKSEKEAAGVLEIYDKGDDGSVSHSEEEKDGTMASGSEGKSEKEAAGVSEIYDGWDGDDAMEQ